jgi:4-amino-4-deoxy-L-arabinose transferase-like glycosyltransferase
LRRGFDARARNGKLRHLLLCALMLGLGFNIKMLQAYLALPAVEVAYLLFAKEPFLKRLGKSVLSLAVVLCVSLRGWRRWILRPRRIGRTLQLNQQHRNELIIGHNGLERIVGRTIGGGAGNAMGPNMLPNTAGGANSIFQGYARTACPARGWL